MSSKVEGAEALASAQAELRAEFCEKQVAFSDVDAALDAVKAAPPDCLVLIAVGVPWSLPCRAHFAHLAAACAVEDPQRVRLFAVDHACFRAFAPDVAVGVPATIVAVGGRQLRFRGRKALTGMLSAAQCVDLIDAVRARTSAEDVDFL